MLKRLHVRNFTAFAEAEFTFNKGLNVVVGTNGTGKSHVLKLGYLVTRVTAKVLNDERPYFRTQHTWQEQIARRLLDVFQPDEVADLIRNNASNQVAAVEAEIKPLAGKLSFEFTGASEENRKAGMLPVQVAHTPDGPELAGAVFIPPKEVLTMPWLRTVRKERRVRLDDTYPALLDLMEPAPLYELGAGATQALGVLENQVLEGQVEEIDGRYYLHRKQGGRLEMNLVAEGLRKFGMLERLLRNGSLTEANTLFWDEPEANLNPALLRKMALLLVGLAKAGFQIILATHSLFLLKEFHIQARLQNAPVRYFGLSSEPSGTTRVATSDNLELLPDIVALDAELDQADRFQEVLDQEDAK